MPEDIERLADCAVATADADDARGVVALPIMAGFGTYFEAFANLRFRRSSTTWYSAESSV